MNKKEPGFNIHIDTQNSNEEVINNNVAAPFWDSLIETFQDGACHLLEAKRLSNSDSLNVEMHTIINDETKLIRDIRSDLFK